MLITLLRSYPKLDENGKQKLDRSGNPITVFVYRVKGTKPDLDEFETIQTGAGHTCKDKDGYLWFTVRPVGKTGTLLVSAKGKIYADTTAIDLASAMIKQHGQLGQMLAKQILDEGFVSQQTVFSADENKPLDE